MRFAAAVLIVSLCHGLSVPPRVQRAPGRPGLMLASPVVRLSLIHDAADDSTNV